MAEFRKLIAITYPTLAEAQENGVFTWVRPKFCNDELTRDLGSVYCDTSKHGCGLSYTGIPGTVEVPAKYARLFAAAPDLLGLLRAGVELHQKHYGNSTALHLAMIEWAIDAQVAIAKAEGQP